MNNFSAILKDSFRMLRVLIIRVLFFRQKKVMFGTVSLILAPHPDDEVFGCSGLMQQLLHSDKELYIVILTSGEGSHRGCCDVDTVTLASNRRALVEKANRLLGINNDHLFFLRYEDGNINFFSNETCKLKEIIDNIQPDAIFVPHHGEGWTDHLATREIGLKLASKQMSVYEYCVWFWYYNTWNLDWKNAFTLSMTKAEHTLKNRAIDTYVLPKAPCGKPWSGVLPKVFINAARWNRELYFRIK